MKIRSETSADVQAIGEVTVEAFRSLEISEHTEQLISEGLSLLKGTGARGCCLVGHPAYYRELGFENTPGLVVEGVPQEVFLAMSFDGRIPQGTATFHEAFKSSTKV